MKKKYLLFLLPAILGLAACSGGNVNPSNNPSDEPSHESTDSTEAHEHNWDTEWTVDLEPTCTEKGYKSHHCKDCNEKKDVTEIPALGHSYGEWVVKTAPTCDSEGEEQRTCSRCGKVESRVISRTSHNYGEVVYTWSEDYLTVTAKRTCSICDDVEEETVNTTKEVITAESCLTGGKVKYTSEAFINENFEIQIKEVDVPAKGHRWDTEWTIDVEPTCTKVGSKSHHCLDCDEKKDVTEIPAKGHTEETKIENKVEATCEEEGSYDLVTYCSVCGEVISTEHKTIAATGHNWDTEWTTDVEPTCTEAGSKSHHCLDCDAKKDVTSIPALGHSFGEWEVVKEATCTEEGEEKRTCSVCGKEETRVIAKIDHEYSEPEYTWNDDYTILTATHKCIHCGKVETEKVNAIEKIVKEPTCTEEGITKYVSNAFINKDFLMQEIKVNTPAKGHRWSEDWTVDLEPTCTTEGSKSHHCLDCDAKKDVTVIPTLKHEFGQVSYVWSKDFTTLTARRGCVNCDFIEEETVNVTKQVIEAPTCLNGGRVQYISDNFNNLNFESQTKIVLVPALGHNWESEWTIDKAPTCDQPGEKSHHCSNCGERKDITIIDMTEHNFGEWTIVTEPTCNSEGEEQRICSDCGKVETRVINKLEHNFGEVTYIWGADNLTVIAKCECSLCGKVETETVKATKVTIKKPTCTETGLDKYISESFNNPYFNAQEKDITIPALGHNWDTEWTVDVEPTCTTEGSKSHHCSNCGERKDVTSIPALGHSFGDWKVTKAPTCHSEGEEQRICSTCGKTETRVISKLEHQFGEVTYVWNEDHSVLTASRTCSLCNDVESEKVNSTSTITKQPTCTETGLEKFVSNDFKNPAFTVQEVEVVIESKGHRWSEDWTIDLEPTCTELGSKSHHCLDCDAKKDVTSIPVLGHTEKTRVENRVEPTCTEEGGYDLVTYCEICGTVISTEHKTIPAKGHNWDTEWTIDVEPTCTEAGSKSHHCLDCDAKKDVTSIPALGHSFGDWVVVLEPTCHSEGREERTCSICGKVESRVISKVPHTFGEVTYSWNEDYSILTATRTCSECGEAEKEKVNVTSQVITSATCTQAGLIRYTSEAFTNSAFEVQVKEVSLPAKGHRWNPEWTIDVDPTCTEAGSKSHHCFDCDAKKDVTSIPALGHTFGDWVVTKQPTFTETGLKQRTCSVCGEVETQTIAKLTNATFSNFKDAIDNSKVTNAVTSVKYEVIDLGVTLNYSSNLTVEYGSTIKAKYDYSYDELNHIGSNDMISTKEGTYYAKGNTIGEVQNGSIKWNTGTESSVSFVNINFAEGVFASTKITGNKFVGTVDESKVTAFFGKPHNVSGLTVEITLGGTNYDVISDIKMTYTDTTTNASVTSITSYFYDKQTVVIPN